MGSPVSVVVANLYMEDLEKTVLSDFMEFIKLWIRFVDDVFCVIKIAKIQSLLSKLNTHSPSIEFTVEKEKDKKLPFRDSLVIRQSDGPSLQAIASKISFDVVT